MKIYTLLLIIIAALTACQKDRVVTISGDKFQDIAFDTKMKGTLRGLESEEANLRALNYKPSTCEKTPRFEISLDNDYTVKYRQDNLEYSKDPNRPLNELDIQEETVVERTNDKEFISEIQLSGLKTDLNGVKKGAATNLTLYKLEQSNNDNTRLEWTTESSDPSLGESIAHEYPGISAQQKITNSFLKWSCDFDEISDKDIQPKRMAVYTLESGQSVEVVLELKTRKLTNYKCYLYDSRAALEGKLDTVEIGDVTHSNIIIQSVEPVNLFASRCEERFQVLEMDKLTDSHGRVISMKKKELLQSSAVKN